MKYFNLLFVSSALISFSTFAQTEIDLANLSRRVTELSEVTAEHSEIIKRQMIDLHKDQNSRGYLEIKIGRSTLNPEDIEDENNDTFGGMDDANWESFDYANIIDFEIGKTILGKADTKHEFGIGYQHLRSKNLQASFLPSGGGRIKVTETIITHTIFARYAHLFKITSDDRLYMGPGVTVGYSPISKLVLELERGDDGSQIYGENTSFLFEFFGKAKYEFTRYFYMVGMAGYRLQEAENLRLNAAELVSIKTKTDLDVSGFFAAIGLGTSF
jgi:hypothetical protein